MSNPIVCVNTSMDFQKLSYYKNVGKKTFTSQQTYLYIWVTDILKFYEDLFCTL